MTGAIGDLYVVAGEIRVVNLTSGAKRAWFGVGTASFCIGRRGALVEMKSLRGVRVVARVVDDALAAEIDDIDARIAKIVELLTAAKKGKQATLEAALPRLSIAQVRVEKWCRAKQPLAGENDR